MSEIDISRAVFAAAVHAFLLMFILSRGAHSEIRLPLIAFEGAALIFSLGYVGVRLAESKTGFDMWLLASYSGVIFLPALWLILARRLQRIERAHTENDRTVAELLLLTAAAAVWLLVVTNPFHGQFITSQFRGKSEFHWGWWIHATFGYACIALSIVIFMQEWLRARSRLARARFAILLVSPSIVVSASVAYFLFLPTFSTDPTPDAVSAAGCLLVFGVQRFGLFGVPRLGLQGIVESSRDGILVQNAEGRLRYANGAAAAMLDGAPPEAGPDVRSVLMGTLDLPTMSNSFVELNGAVVATSRAPICWFEIEVEPLDSKWWQGYSVIRLQDVTARVKAEAGLRRHEEREELFARRTEEARRLAAAINQVEDGVVVVDSDGVIESSNAAG